MSSFVEMSAAVLGSSALTAVVTSVLNRKASIEVRREKKIEEILSGLDLWELECSRQLGIVNAFSFTLIPATPYARNNAETFNVDGMKSEKAKVENEIRVYFPDLVLDFENVMAGLNDEILEYLMYAASCKIERQRVDQSRAPAFEHRFRKFKITSTKHFSRLQVENGFAATIRSYHYQLRTWYQSSKT